MSKQQYIDSLLTKGPDYVWQFTKQETDFNKVINATKLFAEWKYNTDKSIPLEDYYTNNSVYYNIVDRHRTLIIAQLYGLLTKNHSLYKDEDTTPVYKKIINADNVGEYNKLVTEQILKIKLSAITDSRNTTFTNRHIYPILFVYQVLKALATRGIMSISIYDFYLFVMTQNTHSDIGNTVNLISGTDTYFEVDGLINEYKGRSRVLNILRNLDVFIIDDSTITINQNYQISTDSFISSHQAQFLATGLTIDENYKDFLYTSQGFNLSLIGAQNNPLVDSIIEIKEDNEYIINVNKTDDLSNEFIESLKDSHSLQPEYAEHAISKPKRDARLGKAKIITSNYLCDYDNAHLTFIAKSTNKNYVEAHHLIPMQYQKIYWEQANKNIDCIQNIVSLCPTCHRMLHYGIMTEKEEMLKDLYAKMRSILHSIGINITEDDLIGLYI